MQRFITKIIVFFQRPHFITSHISSKKKFDDPFSQESVTIRIEMIAHKTKCKDDKQQFKKIKPCYISDKEACKGT